MTGAPPAAGSPAIYTTAGPPPARAERFQPHVSERLLSRSFPRVSKPTPTSRGGKTCCERSALSCSGWMKPIDGHMTARRRRVREGQHGGPLWKLTKRPRARAPPSGRRNRLHAKGRTSDCLTTQLKRQTVTCNVGAIDAGPSRRSALDALNMQGETLACRSCTALSIAYASPHLQEGACYLAAG